jgi:hypothetical protein
MKQKKKMEESIYVCGLEQKKKVKRSMGGLKGRCSKL